MTTTHTPQAAHPLQTTGALVCVVHMLGGKPIRDELPELQAELVSAENDVIQDVVDAMDSATAESEG